MAEKEEKPQASDSTGDRPQQQYRWEDDPARAEQKRQQEEHE